MNKSNKQIIREAINTAASDMAGKLPESSKHPKGRNPHAHIATVLKAFLGKSYTDCADYKVEYILQLITETKNHPF
jgi:hypothetical protein